MSDPVPCIDRVCSRSLAALALFRACGSGAAGPAELPLAEPPMLEVRLTDLSRVRNMVPTGSISGNEIVVENFLFDLRWSIE